MKKNMKQKVFFFLGMGSCISSPGDQRSSVIPDSSALEAEKKTKEDAVTLKALVFDAKGSKDEVFFDSKPWLESDDEDFLSVNGDYSPLHKLATKNGDPHAGRKLSELFKDSSSFSSDSQTSQKAAEEATGHTEKLPEAGTTPKMEKVKKTEKTGQRCLPSLVRTLSCGDRKKRMSPKPAHISVAG